MPEGSGEGLGGGSKSLGPKSFLVTIRLRSYCFINYFMTSSLYYKYITIINDASRTV